MKTPVVVEAALIRGVHEQAAFTHEDASEIHGAIGVAWSAIGFKVVNLHFGRGVLVPSRFAPQWFAVATVAIGFGAEEFIAPSRRSGIKVDVRTGFQSGQGQLKNL